MTDSWWAKKLGHQTITQERPSAPVAAPGAPMVPTGGMTATGQQAQLWQAQQAEGPPPVMIDDPTAPGGKRMNWRAWAGGQGTREEQSRCPACGSTNYFSRKQNSIITQNGTAHPAPQCFNCSYNGAFQIFGGDS